jgi:Flp pilus assembly pilin Flp
MDPIAVPPATHPFWQGIPTLVVVLGGLIAVAATFVKELSIHAETIRVLEISSKRLAFWTDWLKAMNCTDQSGPHWDRAQKEFVAAALAAESALDNPKSYAEIVSRAVLELFGYFLLIIGIVVGLFGIIQSIARPRMGITLRIEYGAISILIALVVIFVARALFRSAKQARSKIPNHTSRAR